MTMGAAAELDDLEALFDQVAADTAAKSVDVKIEEKPQAQAAEAAANEPADMFHRVGQLTRTLHDALRELGYDKSLQCAADTLPDARDRLNYIATLTGQAAERALTAVERGQALQKGVGGESARLAKSWDALHAGKLSVDEFKALAAETRVFFAALPAKADETGAQFHEIMMAQDFHDLTGQVINRVVTLATTLETQLIKMLIEARPAGQGTGTGASSGDTEWLTGPAMNAGGRSDVVANQAQVDELLGSLGF
jgi:chemotaxis protein CheZ